MLYLGKTACFFISFPKDTPLYDTTPLPALSPTYILTPPQTARPLSHYGNPFPFYRTCTVCIFVTAGAHPE